jgi:hypothetical protein
MTRLYVLIIVTLKNTVLHTEHNVDTGRRPGLCVSKFRLFIFDISNRCWERLKYSLGMFDSDDETINNSLETSVAI